MKREKTFDCVEMKRQIQAKHLKEIQELGEEEFRRRAMERVLADPILGPFWRKAPRVPQTNVQGGGKAN
ncbi:MAG: hypothetical protein HY608_03510 [Planctomycetes bacterium]|nr:hypothetical protein [Planctomycetota bacterium]